MKSETIRHLFLDHDIEAPETNINIKSCHQPQSPSEAFSARIYPQTTSSHFVLEE